MGLVPTTATPTQSQRSEFYGSYALAIILKIFKIRYNLPNTPFEIYIDNQNVVDTLNITKKQPGLKQHLHEDFDIWESIQDLLKEIDITIIWTWVKGHQDDLIPWEELTFPAQLNVKADRLTKKAYEEIQHEPPTYKPSHSSKITILQHNQLVSHTNLRITTQSSIHLQPLLDYMSTKYEWTQQTQELIDWKLYELGYNKTPADKMTNIIKYIHRWKNTGSQKLAMGESETQCQQYNNLETQHH